MYRSLLLLVIVTGAIAAAAAAASDIPCNRTDLEASCEVKFPDRLVVHNGSVYVGLENKLVRFDLELNLSTMMVREPMESAVSRCKRYKQPHCGNYVLTMLVTNLTDNDISTTSDYSPFVNKTVLLICSTFGFSPQCQLCDPNNISHCVNTSEEVKSGYSPYDRRFNNVYTLTKDRIFYTGSSFDDKNGLQAVAKFPSPFLGLKFSLHTYTQQAWRWLFNPTFISMYEVNQYIYFFWREEAFEADMRVYTRVGRLCKSDNGLNNNSSTSTPSFFSTFVKARMTCSSPPDSNNHYPFEYNHLQATYLMDNGSSPVLYAVFSTPSNGPPSSVICTYSFSSGANTLDTIFNGHYLFGDSSNDVWSRVDNPTPFDCPGEGPNQRNIQDAEKYLLMEEPVQQSTPQPLYNETGAYITALVVKTVQWDGQPHEVFYIGMSNGVVKQVVWGISEVKLYTTPSNHAVNKLVIHENNSRIYCYITSDDNIAVIQLGHCDYYTSCSQCTKDIYCRWNGSSCTDDITATADVVCPSPSVTISVTTHTVTMEKPTPVTIVNEPNTINDDDDKACNNLPVVIGALFGGIVLGFIVGAVIFVIIYFIKRPRGAPNKSVEKQGSVESKEYDDDAFAPQNQPGNTNFYTCPPRPMIAHERINTAHYIPPQGRGRTESTKRLISISSDLYPESPSPPNTLPMPKHVE